MTKWLVYVPTESGFNILMFTERSQAKSYERNYLKKTGVKL